MIIITEDDVRNRIIELMNAKQWSKNRLAKESDLAQSTVDSMFNKNNLPTIPTLLKICNGLGVTASQFFLSPQDYIVSVNKDQKELIESWNMLEYRDQQNVKALINSMKSNRK